MVAAIRLVLVRLREKSADEHRKLVGVPFRAGVPFREEAPYLAEPFQEEPFQEEPFQEAPFQEAPYLGVGPFQEVPYLVEVPYLGVEPYQEEEEELRHILAVVAPHSHREVVTSSKFKSIVSEYLTTR